MADTRTTALAYLEAWKRKDTTAIGNQLHVDVQFTGPMTRNEGRDSVMASFEPLFPLLDDFLVRHLLVEGVQAVAIYDFICVDPIGSIRMAELIGVEGGLVRSIELFFDTRPFEAAIQSRSSDRGTM